MSISPCLLINSFPGPFVAGVVNFLESIEGVLVASLGRNLPVADCDFMIAQLVFGRADVVAGDSTAFGCLLVAKK